MDFNRTEEQQMIVAELLQEYRDKFIPKDVMKDIQKQLMNFGLTTAPHPEKYGGLGLDWQTHLMLIEEVTVTASDLTVPIVINTVAILARSAQRGFVYKHGHFRTGCWFRCFKR